MPLEFAHTAVDCILPDEDFRISFHPAAPSLFGVREFGILQPVVLFPKENHFLVVCGFRRVEAVRGLGQPAVPALRCCGLDRKQAVLVGLLERLSHGVLNDVERARSIDKFSKNGWSKEELIDYLFPLLEIKFNEMIFKQLAALLTLPQEIQERVAQGEIYLHTAHRLSQWAPCERHIAGWFAALRLGVNKQRELLDLMDDVARVCKVEKAALVQELEQISRNEQPARVYDAWLRHLRVRRYPRLTEAQRQFEETKARFRLPGQIQLNAPPFFEENQYRVSFAFSSREELDRYARKLMEVAGAPELDVLLKLI